MEDRRRKSISGDKFSFPVFSYPDQDELGGATPGSPKSVADHLFLNGRLLPHPFPFQPAVPTASGYSRSSSAGGKDSPAFSSRSSSTSSRNSSNASARTSTSEAGHRQPRVWAAAGREKWPVPGPLIHQYGSSQRWQFIAPVPAGVSGRRGERQPEKEGPGPRRGKDGCDRAGRRSGFGRRIFRSFVSACKECHAITPSARIDVLEGSVKLQRSMKQFSVFLFFFFLSV
ncbi:hypothetical protein NMG60_11003402 [Bertholletia excelsa]